MSTQTRARNKRQIAVAKPDTAQMGLDKLAVETFFANRRKNEASREESKGRKELFAAMKAGKIDTFTVETMDGNNQINLVAKIATPEGSAVDVAKLQKLVTMDQFLQIVSATQKAVSDIVGTAILNQCTVATKGTENVTVAVVK